MEGLGLCSHHLRTADASWAVGLQMQREQWTQGSLVLTGPSSNQYRALL